MQEKNYCEGCGNHCPLTNLKCERGRRLANGVSNSKEVNINETHDTNHEIIHLLRKIGHNLHFRSEIGGQKRILNLISNEENITQVELTKNLDIKSGSASELLGKLENKGLIKRIPSPEDNRTTIVKITEEGKKEAMKGEDSHKEFYHEMFANLNTEERESLLVLLKKINLKDEHHHDNANMHHKSHHSFHK